MVAYWHEEWSSQEWLETVQTWVDHVLEVYQLERAGDLQRRRDRDFSALLAVPTNMGRLWFKASNPNQLHEATLTAQLSELVPHRVPKPLSIEPNLGWSLTPDYGETFMALPAADPAVWQLMLADYATFQQELTTDAHPDQVFNAGVMVLDPEWLPQYLESQLEIHAMTDPDHPFHLDGAAADRLFVNLDQIQQWCHMLADGPVPLMLDHQDLHRHNVLVPATLGAPLRYLDFSDTFWAHPFSSLAKPLRTIAAEFQTKLDPADPRIAAIIGAYLEKFSSYGTTDELFDLLEPALRMARLQEHQIWMTLMAGTDEDTQRKYATDVLRPLRQLLEPVLITD